MNKNVLKERLQKEVLTVTFTKTNGETRVMECTLQESYLPRRATSAPTERKENPAVLAVWDINKSAFRSFRVDNVTNVC